MNDNFDKLLNAGRLEEAEAVLGDADDAQTLYRRGRLAWKRGDKGAAISFYEQSSALDPDGPASLALEQARSIMNFYNRDLYNP